MFILYKYMHATAHHERHEESLLDSPSYDDISTGPITSKSKAFRLGWSQRADTDYTDIRIIPVVAGLDGLPVTTQDRWGQRGNVARASAIHAHCSSINVAKAIIALPYMQAKRALNMISDYTLTLYQIHRCTRGSSVWVRYTCRHHESVRPCPRRS